MRPTKYSKAVLEPLVRSSRSLAEVIRRLGLPPTGGNYRYIGGRVRHAKLDTSHFQQRLSQRAASVSKSQLESLVRQSTSVAQVLERLSLPVVGRPHRALTQRIIELGLDTSHFRGQGWARGETRATHPGLTSSSRKLRVPDEEVFVENSHYTKTPNIRMRLIEKGWPHRCAICGIASWLDTKLVLHLDHINGVHNDNRIENLRFLCPNCHSQTDTYCRRRG